MELGDARQANEELDSITPAVQVHPAVLSARWSIYAKLKRFDGCLEISRTLKELKPHDLNSWIFYANSLYWLNRTQEAWDVLSPMAKQFPKSATIPYNLACYVCQLGDLVKARELLEKAIRIDGSKRFRLMALEDKDLEPLWGKLGGT